MRGEHHLPRLLDKPVDALEVELAGVLGFLGRHLGVGAHDSLVRLAPEGVAELVGDPLERVAPPAELGGLEVALEVLDTVARAAAAMDRVFGTGGAL